MDGKDVSEILERINREPFVHVLIRDAYLAHWYESDEITFGPLKKIYMKSYVNYISVYHSDILGLFPSVDGITNLAEQSSHSVVLVSFNSFEKYDSPEKLEEAMLNKIESVKNTISWIAGENPKEFAMITKCNGQVYSRLIVEKIRKRLLMGISL